MKKLLTILLALALVLSLALPVAAEETKNYGEDLKWSGLNSTVKVNDGVVTVTDVKYAWSSPMADILPSVKAMLGTDIEAEIVITFDIRATFIEGKEGEFVTGNILLRADNNLGIPAADTGDWTEAYEEMLDGEDPFFTNPDSNIRHHFQGVVAEMTDEEWITIEIPVTLLEVHVKNTAVKNWNFCFDGLSNPAIVKTIEIKNFGIYLADEYEDAEKPQEATPEPTPEVTPEPTATPVPTEAPVATPTLEPTPLPTPIPPIENENNDDGANDESGPDTYIIIGIVAAVVVVGAVIAVVVLKKKKTDGK